MVVIILSLVICEGRILYEVLEQKFLAVLEHKIFQTILVDHDSMGIVRNDQMKDCLKNFAYQSFYVFFGDLVKICKWHLLI